MNTIDERDVQAYVDGELAPEDAARVKAAADADAALARRIEQARRLRERLRAGFDPVLGEPVPDRLLALLRDAPAQAPVGPMAAGQGLGETGDTGTVVPLAARRPTARPRWHAPVYALAASIAVLAIATWMQPAGTGPYGVEADALVARGSLAQALDRTLASEPVEGHAVAVGLSFRDTGGRLCRSFTRHGEAVVAGLACREGEEWVLPVLAQVDPAEAGPIRQAGSVIPPEVQAAIDARIAGEAFDAEQERAAREAGWR